jgi:hypothetical protein
MYYILLSIISFFNFNQTEFYMNNNCYEIKSQNYLHKLILKNNFEIVEDGEQLSKFRTALLYQLKDQRIVVVPSEIYKTGEGIIFKNLDCFNSFLVKDELPIMNPDKNFLEFDQQLVQNINIEINSVLNDLNDEFGGDYLKPDKDAFIYYHNKLLELFESQNPKYSPQLSLKLFLLGGEIIRKKNKGKWILKKEAGVFNPYYEPLVVLDDGKLILLSHLLLSKFSNGIKMNDFLFEQILNTNSLGMNRNDLDLAGINYLILD